MGWSDLSDTFVFLNWVTIKKYSIDRSIDFLDVRIFWNFDNTLQDLYNNFNGYGLNNPNFSSPGYNGAGSCIQLIKSQNQSITISSPPFLNMANTSFTIQAWINPQSLCNGSGCRDNALFGQYEQNTPDRSLHIIVRNRTIYLGFYNDDVSGNIVSYSTYTRF